MMAGEFLAEGHNGDVYIVDEGASLLEQLEWVSWSTSQSAVQLRFLGGRLSARQTSLTMTEIRAGNEEP